MDELDRLHDGVENALEREKVSGKARRKEGWHSIESISRAFKGILRVHFHYFIESYIVYKSKIDG